MADQHERGRALRRKASRDTGSGYEPGTQARVISPGQAVSGGRQAARRVTYRKSSLGPKHMLTAELIIGLGIVLVRIVADYEPQANGTVKGQVGHPQGQLGPIPTAAGLIGSFFVLSFFVAKGGKWATVANSFGALIIIVLAIRSLDEADAVVATFTGWGKGTLPAGTTASSWDTSGSASILSGATAAAPTGTTSPSLTQQSTAQQQVTQDQQSLATTTKPVPNKGVPFVEAQAENAATLAKDAYQAYERDVFDPASNWLRGLFGIRS